MILDELSLLQLEVSDQNVSDQVYLENLLMT